MFAYEHTPCGACRERAVDEWKRLGTLPTWVAEEYAFDAGRDAADGEV